MCDIGNIRNFSQLSRYENLKRPRCYGPIKKFQKQLENCKYGLHSVQLFTLTSLPSTKLNNPAFLLFQSMRHCVKVSEERDLNVGVIVNVPAY